MKISKKEAKEKYGIITNGASGYQNSYFLLENGDVVDNDGNIRFLGSKIRQRLEELRKEIRAERISYGEIAELQGLKNYIENNDVELLEWAGVPEFKN
jgi:hypothetical protein